MATTVPSPILTLEEAASYLRLNVEDLKAELESGYVPGLKVAGRWRIKRETLERLLDAAAATGDETTTDSVLVDTTAAQPQSTVTQPTVTQQPASVAETSTTPQEATPAGHDSGSPFQLPPATIALAPPPGRVRAHVFSYNAKQGFGHARLPDNRVVWLDSQHLIQHAPVPFPGDIVEFELIRSRKGLEARAARIIPKGDGHNVAASARAGTVTSDTGRQPGSLPSPAISLPPPTQRPKTKIPPSGTSKSQGLYQNAAVARAEGRIADARRLFRQSIEAGGGTHVYEAFFKMELEKGSRADARRIIQQAIGVFPDHINYYDMYGQMERRARNYQLAERIFRQGLARSPRSVNLRWGLGQTLVQIGTESSLREAGRIFEDLEREGRLHKHDALYQRFKALQRSPRANRAYDFFQQITGMRVGLAGRGDLPWQITDIVTETNNQELSDSFGLSGAYLVRCFQRLPLQIEILNLSKYLQSFGPQGVLGLQDGREVVINPSLAFIAVPDIDAVRDQVMSILSESNEAIVPLDDKVFQNSEDPLKTLRDLLGQYLGSRDLYSSTQAVFGRRFFGRERLLLQVTDEVHRGQFLGIYGLRKIGKTSLIYQLRDVQLKGEAMAYVDLQASAALTEKDCAPLYWELERDLYVRLRERSPEAAGLLRLGKVERYSELQESGSRVGLLFAEDLRAFLDALSAGGISGVKRLVIVLDELERILPVTGYPGINGYVQFFGMLRGLAQNERYRGLLSSVVVAANAVISERSYWEGRENPVFALYKPVFLPPLSENESVAMIRTLGKGMSVYWDDDAIRAVFAETGGHPFLTRSLCSRIAKQHPARPLNVTADMVQGQVVPFIRDESDKLEQITELLRTNFPEEERLLEQIALGEATMELSDEAVRHLVGYQLVAADGTGYRVTLNLLRRWLRRRAGIKE